MKKRVFYRHLLTALVISSLAFGCNKSAKINKVGKKSSKTGVAYKKDSFMPKKFKKQKAAPGMVLVPGGTFMMGGGEKDIQYAQDNRTRQVTVQSFYLDKEEVSNVDWKEFLYHVENGGQGSEAVALRVEELYPDTTVWKRDLAFNEPLVNHYFQHEAFYTYPVVGINWHQANEYCKWRTAFINGRVTKNGKISSKKETSSDKKEDAVKFPSFRLPTEAEWEYAARGHQESEVYAWEGKSLRNRKGNFRANFKRGRGDYAGWRGGNGKHMTDKYMTPAPVGEFWPNDFGLYNMSGNVAEWCQDAYRVLSYEDVDDFNPYRKSGKTVIRPDSWLDDDDYDPKSSLLFNPDKYAAEGSGEFDNVKVYRGGSWYDIAYYLSPGVRRFYNADSSSNTIGFRCAMIRVGSPD